MENKRILVAGGSSGIGRELVRILVQEGGQVTAIGRDIEKLAALQSQLPSVTIQSLDAKDPFSVKAFLGDQQPFDHLVLAVSGGKGGGSFADLDLTDLREGFESKFWPQLELAQAALPKMKPTGSITFITAISATAKLPGTAGLAALNGAIELMVPILAKELKPLRVNAVSPGVIDTGWWDFLPADIKAQTFENFSRQVAVGRVGRPEEVASVIRMILCTEYINGEIIGVHGGL